MTYQSDHAPLRRVLLRHASDAFVDDRRITEQWRVLGFTAPPEYDAACREHDAFAGLLERLGVRVEWMAGGDLGLDSIYTRDASVVCDEGVVRCRMGKEARAAEPPAQAARLAELGVPCAGGIEGEGHLEGGDAVWLRPDVLAVGRGYRTDESGIDQLRALLADRVEVVRVPLPHWRGPGDVFHLMSVVSPLAEDLALVHSPLLTVPFREKLLGLGFELVEVPEGELDSQGCNVLAVAPRVAVALDGNPETRRRMEAAGVEVHTYRGTEISQKGCGGPTCLTRPLERG